MIFPKDRDFKILNRLAPWNPTFLGGSVLEDWYDANQQNEAADAQVLSFVGRHGAKNFTGATGPLLKYNFVNGRKALQCNGNQLSHANTILASVTSCALFWSAKGTVDPSIAPADEAPLNGFGTGGVCHYFTDGIWYESGGASTRRTVNPPTPWSDWHVAGVVSQPGRFRLYWNGTIILDEAVNTVNTGVGTRTLFNRGATGSFAGHFHELVLCKSAPSDQQIADLNIFMKANVGI